MTTIKDPTLITPLESVKSSISGLDYSDLLDLKTHLDSLFTDSGPVDAASLGDPNLEPGEIPEPALAADDHKLPAIKIDDQIF